MNTLKILSKGLKMSEEKAQAILAIAVLILVILGVSTLVGIWNIVTTWWVSIPLGCYLLWRWYKVKKAP